MYRCASMFRSATLLASLALSGCMLDRSPIDDGTRPFDAGDPGDAAMDAATPPDAGAEPDAGCTPGPELCNGVDDDCDGTLDDDGADDPALGAPCDGDDADLCEGGTLACVGGALVCEGDDGDLPSEVELCDGLDNDCNPATPDGAAEPTIGDACDDDDADLCADGALACVDGAMVCAGEDGDQPDEIEVCDGIDNDCNPATADGASDPALGTACDGLDADLCMEGVLECAGGALSCNDATGDTVETCDGRDEDCDGTIDEGPICPDGCARATFGGHAYLFCEAQLDWEDAADACATLGAYRLVTIDDAAEQAFVHGEASRTGAARLWIGLTDQDREGEWRWAGGGALGSYAAWQSGQPDDGGLFEAEDCAAMVPDATSAAGEPGGWNDTECSKEYRYVCEAGP